MDIKLSLKFFLFFSPDIKFERKAPFVVLYFQNGKLVLSCELVCQSPLEIQNFLCNAVWM